MIVFPNAKINLGLNVVSKRADGYHDLQTIFLPVKGLHDELEVTRSAEVDPYTFCQEGIAVDCAPENNLIIRAYERMRAAYTQVGNVHIRFCKQIPFGAGLGGGSADAAFMVRALNELFELKMTNEQKEEMVAPLGADCAFFVQNRPRMAEGIGTVFSEVPEVFLPDSGPWDGRGSPLRQDAASGRLKISPALVLSIKGGTKVKAPRNHN